MIWIFNLVGLVFFFAVLQSKNSFIFAFIEKNEFLSSTRVDLRFYGAFLDERL